MRKKSHYSEITQPSKDFLSEDARRFDLWQRSIHRKIIFSLFYISLTIFISIFVLHLLPVGDGLINESCSKVTNRHFEGPAVNEVQKDSETTVTCEGRSMSGDVIIAGSVTIGSTLIALLAFELGWFRVEIPAVGSLEGGSKRPTVPDKVMESSSELMRKSKNFPKKEK